MQQKKQSKRFTLSTFQIAAICLMAVCIPCCIIGTVFTIKIEAPVWNASFEGYKAYRRIGCVHGHTEKVFSGFEVWLGWIDIRGWQDIDSIPISCNGETT